MHDIIATRPEPSNSKVGTGGTIVMLKANFFKVEKSPQWKIYQYHVDFTPDVEAMNVRKGLIFTHKPQLGGLMFDGSMLFLMKRLPNERTELFSTRRDGEQIQITIKFVGEVSNTDGRFFQILNLILRRGMEGLKLQLVGRNFFDAVAKTDIPQHRLQLWPGYQTSIRQHEQDILVCCEITHKVMRCSTVLDILRECTTNSRDFKTTFAQQMIGQVVLTDYNNKTYRIDDVDFDSTPQSTFSTKNGDISYVDYYKKRYNITIRDGRQPMLISRAKARDLRGGQNELMALVPELCRSTGLTDAMRSNFQLMKAMSEYTRLGPSQRIEKLRRFNQRLRSTKESDQVFRDWSMKLDPQLVEFDGRLLERQTLKFGQGKETSVDECGSWSKYMQNAIMLTSINLKNWHVIVTNRNAQDARQFARELQSVGRGMQFEIREPKIIAIGDERSASFIQAIESVANEDPQLIMCVLPKNSSDQ
jgi:aubergine